MTPVGLSEISRMAEADRVRRVRDAQLSAAQRTELERLRTKNRELVDEHQRLRAELNKHFSIAVRSKRLSSQAGADQVPKSELTRAEKLLAHEQEKARHRGGEDIDDYSEEELLALRDELATVQERVHRMLERRAAEVLVVAKFPDYQCSLSLSLMRDPVVTADGQSYERMEIEQWFGMCKEAQEPVTSPLRARLASDALCPNNSLRRAIEAAVEHECGLLRAAKRARAD